MPELKQICPQCLTFYSLENLKHCIFCGNQLALNKGVKPSMKKSKKDLRRDTVQSNTMHVGIELELFVPGTEKTHDDGGCRESYASNFSSNPENLLRDEFGISRSDAENIARYFDAETYINDRMEDYECDDNECPHFTCDDIKEEVENDLIELTGNNSFKVVEDGSIRPSTGCVDAEVCWNYFISKDTVKDNAKILAYLKDKGASFNSSCGLHINLNNYLNLEKWEVPTESLETLFYFVAPSRRRSSFCTKMAISNKEKYSMIYHQGDRLEFRFFSPTMEADKLNHYVTLANVIYQRLSGKDKKIPKKTAEYFIKKMTEVNGLPVEIAKYAIEFVNTLKTIRSLGLTRTTEIESDEVAA